MNDELDFTNELNSTGASMSQEHIDTLLETTLVNDQICFIANHPVKQII